MLSFWSITLTALLVGTTTTVRSETTSEEIAAYIVGIIGEYDVYPPIDPNPKIWDTGTVKPIDVIALQSVLSINSIDPQNSEFTATTRFSYYWTANDCNQTKAHQLACDRTLSEGKGFKFFTQTTANGLPQRLLTISEPNIHQAVFEEEGLTHIQPDAEQIETRTTYSQVFDMRYFPWEVHALKIPLTSLYSTDIVKVTRLPNNIESSAEPSVPNGWNFIGIQCGVAITNDNTRPLYDESYEETSDIVYYTYDCTVVVARSNPGWWITSFLLFSALLLIAYAGSVDVASHMVAEARDDRESARRALFDGTRFVGTYTAGLLLTYVFKVQISPYGQSIEYWPRIPTSSMIYVLGLVGIVVQSFAGLMGALIFSRPLLAGDGFVGGLMNAYDLDKVPKEGEVGEERAPLLLKKFDPILPKKGIKKSDGQEEKAAGEVGVEQAGLKEGEAAASKEESDIATKEVKEEGETTTKEVKEEGETAAKEGKEEDETAAKEGKEEGETAAKEVKEEGETAAKEGKLEGETAVAKEEEPKQEGDPSIQRLRVFSQRPYGVLSLEEAAYINVFVRRLFFFKTGLLLAIALTALIMLSVARKNYGDLVRAAAEILNDEELSS